MNIGFIGLGIMGRPMAGHLMAGGHSLHILSSSAAAPDMAKAGAVLCESGAALAQASDVVITMVPDTPEVEGVILGDGGVAEGLCAGKLVIDMSSISPIATKRFAERVRALGAGYVDAPVSGGEVGAKAASLTIMVGGDDADFARVALNIAAVGEAMLFAKAAGADPAKVRQALLGGFASSRVLEVHGERMIARTFNPGFRINLHHKDLSLAIDGGNALGMALPQTAFCQQLMNSMRAAGQGDLDHSGLVLALERLSGTALDS
ncbi:MAG: 2-hydroxy-3-oxopropionate reductase [Alphaproteobacteria bacterium PA3]|nr:MAG: 2-hydroxy-3-oxopropionate reductase [Alphaproteobacteria bacterium PA3]